MNSAEYSVLTESNGKDALAVAERLGRSIHVVVTDLVMPVMRGPELAKLLKARYPQLRIIYMSGYLEYSRDEEAFLEEGFYLQKPFSRDTLVSKVQEALSTDRATILKSF
jgi:two-component system, cell cycle sensor histidine kinase and response regulator CckA